MKILLLAPRGPVHYIPPPCPFQISSGLLDVLEEMTIGAEPHIGAYVREMKEAIKGL